MEQVSLKSLKEAIDGLNESGILSSGIDFDRLTTEQLREAMLDGIDDFKGTDEELKERLPDVTKLVYMKLIKGAKVEKRRSLGDRKQVKKKAVVGDVTRFEATAQAIESHATKSVEMKKLSEEANDLYVKSGGKSNLAEQTWAMKITLGILTRFAVLEEVDGQYKFKSNH